MRLLVFGQTGMVSHSDTLKCVMCGPKFEKRTEELHLSELIYEGISRKQQGDAGTDVSNNKIAARRERTDEKKEKKKMSGVSIIRSQTHIPKFKSMSK